MKSLKFKHGSLKNIIHLPRSKSYGNRALILASVLKQAFTLKAIPESTDVTFLINALKSIGLIIHQNDDDLVVENSFPECEGAGATIEIGEGGTTARFLACLLLRGKAPYTLVLGRRLKDRPWDEFLTLVKKLGGTASLEGDKLSLQGPFEIPESLEVDCEKTTQFASGFQLAWAFTDKQIIPVNLNTSQSYWAMTQDMILKFQLTSSFEIPRDWSSASYPLAYGALHQTIKFPGLMYDSFQSDSKFLDLLKQFEAFENDEVSVLKKSKEIEFQVHDCLDLVPTLGYFLSHIPGTHKLHGIGNLIHKESDRLNDLIKLLGQFDRKAWNEGDTLFIQGSETLMSRPVSLQLADDHRMVMVGALFLIHHQGGTLSPVEAVNKSYPGYFGIFSPESFTDG